MYTINKAHISAPHKTPIQKKTWYKNLRHQDKKYNKHKGKNTKRRLIVSRIDYECAYSCVPQK